MFILRLFTKVLVKSLFSKFRVLQIAKKQTYDMILEMSKWSQLKFLTSMGIEKMANGEGWYLTFYTWLVVVHL